MALTNADYRQIGQGAAPPKGYRFTEALSAIFFISAPAAVLVVLFYRWLSV